jgi:hypothetical protein
VEARAAQQIIITIGSSAVEGTSLGLGQSKRLPDRST